MVGDFFYSRSKIIYLQIGTLNDLTASCLRWTLEKVTNYDFEEWSGVSGL